MSGWDAYINSMVDSSSAIKRAAIVGTDGSLWARTQGTNTFSVGVGIILDTKPASEEELKKFVCLFDNLVNVPLSGVDLEQVHYIVPLTEENLIFGKKEKSGFFATKTKTAVLIVVYEGEHQVSADVRTTVEKMTKYLKDIGF
ncbi:Profilin [Dictyocaulus viviparus]|uniref:Profilin n=1 Tax=Dictyocaulus viviparus TaxID=29172 RepID=A0A0D8XE37_DICVI|nr:Profilin [Dictyocaulus viviparus]